MLFTYNKLSKTPFPPRLLQKSSAWNNYNSIISFGCDNSSASQARVFLTCCTPRTPLSVSKRMRRNFITGHAHGKEFQTTNVAVRDPHVCVKAHVSLCWTRRTRIHAAHGKEFQTTNVAVRDPHVCVKAHVSLCWTRRTRIHAAHGKEFQTTNVAVRDPHVCVKAHVSLCWTRRTRIHAAHGKEFQTTNVAVRDPHVCVKAHVSLCWTRRTRIHAVLGIQDLGCHGFRLSEHIITRP